MSPATLASNLATRAVPPATGRRNRRAAGRCRASVADAHVRGRRRHRPNVPTTGSGDDDDDSSPVTPSRRNAILSAVVALAGASCSETDVSSPPFPAPTVASVRRGKGKSRIIRGAHSLPSFLSPQAPRPRARRRPPARSSSSSRTSSPTPRPPSRRTRATNPCSARGPSSRTNWSECRPTRRISTG